MADGVLGGALEFALETLSPTRCAGCERPGALICDRCLSRFQLIDPRLSCTQCGAPFGSLLCTECQGERGACERVLAAASFEDPVPRIVRAYKDGGERRSSPTCCSIPPSMPSAWPRNGTAASSRRRTP